MMVSSGKPHTQAGLSLVELMVALLISTILLLGVLELFGSSSQTERSANALARLQENGRLVTDLIAREARRTGFYGCDALPDSSGEENFAYEGDKGKIKDFPAQSLQNSTVDSLTFHYFSAAGGAITADCGRAKLVRYHIHFKNCNNGICINSNDTDNKDQTLLNNAKIETVLYIQPCKEQDKAGQTCTYKIGDLPRLEGSGNPSFSAVTKLQVRLRLCTDEKSESSADYCTADSKTKLERTFSSLIELRNRLQ